MPEIRLSEIASDAKIFLEPESYSCDALFSLRKGITRKNRKKNMTPKEAFQKAVIAAIGGNKDHGWGIGDSCKVIEAMLENETGEKPDQELMGWIKRVVNPSQFRQVLEGEKMLNKQESKKRQAEKLFADFVS